MYGHIFSVEKKWKLNEHQERKTREADRSFSGLRRKNIKGHICTPHYEDAKCKPHALMSLRGKAA